MEMKINLNNIEKVKDFVAETTKHDEDMDLISGRYVINAKSIMGIFSLDLSKPINFVINSDDKKFLDLFKPFLA